MREPRRLEAELGALDDGRERENGETTHRCIVIVTGIEFPRFKKAPSTVDKKWHLAASTLPEKGAPWRGRGLRLAEYKLARDPNLTVVLFDLERGTKESVKLVAGKLTSTPMKGFTTIPVDAADYRRFVRDAKGTGGDLVNLDATAIAAPKALRPTIPYCPNATAANKGSLTLADWVKWLKANKKLGHPNLGVGIPHVYDHIEQIGAARPHALSELHLFGHASSSHSAASGTAFVNTYEWRGWNTGLTMKPDERSPLDLDARANVDFMGRPSTFRKAFATDAVSVVWGCNWHVPDHAILWHVRKALGGKKLADAQTFDIPITLSKAEEDEFQKHFSDPFPTTTPRPVQPAPGKWDPKSKTWRGVTGKWLKDYFGALLERTYMQALADASGRCVLGGLPATSSEYDTRQHGADPILLHVPMGKDHYFLGKSGETAQSFLGVMGFFADTFGVKFGPGHHAKFGRGFAYYAPRTP